MSESNFSAIRARLRYETMEEFIDGYGRYISRGGMFVPMSANKLKPVGTTVRFQFLLADGRSAMLGEGVVRQIKGVDSDKGPVGMLVKFSKLSSESKALVEDIVASKEARKRQSRPTPASTPSIGVEEHPPSTREAPKTSEVLDSRGVEEESEPDEPNTGVLGADAASDLLDRSLEGEEAQESVEEQHDEEQPEEEDRLAAETWEPGPGSDVAARQEGSVFSQPGELSNEGPSLEEESAMEESEEETPLFREPEDFGEPEQAQESGGSLFSGFDSSVASEEKEEESQEESGEEEGQQSPFGDAAMDGGGDDWFGDFGDGAEGASFDEEKPDVEKESESEEKFEAGGDESVLDETDTEEPFEESDESEESEEPEEETGPAAVKETEGGLKVMAFDDESVDEDAARDFEAFASGGEEDEVDEMFDGIFGGSDGGGFFGDDGSDAEGEGGFLDGAFGEEGQEGPEEEGQEEQEIVDDAKVVEEDDRDDASGIALQAEAEKEEPEEIGDEGEEDEELEFDGWEESEALEAGEDSDGEALAEMALDEPSAGEEEDAPISISEGGDDELESLLAMDEDEEDGELTLNIGPAPEEEEPEEGDPDDSMESLLASAKEEIESKNKVEEEEDDDRDILDDLLGDDELPPPAAGASTIDVPQPKAKKKKGGLFSKFFGGDD